MKTGAELFVKCLEAQGVKYIFGVPGAKIDGIYNALVDSKQIKLIHCRHEQNAAFMAAAHGRLTGNPGVVLVTSGPGVGNLTTGLLTATTEGDPVVAIGGNVAKNMRSKNAHQNADNVKILEPVTKHACEILTVENIPEMVENAFQIATNRRKGATFISVPQDIQFETTDVEILPPHHDIHATLANQDDIKLCAEMINQAHMPILLLGEDASEAASTLAIRDLLTEHSLPVVSTYQGAGVVSKELVNRFGGRVGLFKTQPGDHLIAQADLVITIGYDPVEYDPEVWNANKDKKIIHMDHISINYRNAYTPEIQLIGSIEYSIRSLITLLELKENADVAAAMKREHDALCAVIEQGKVLSGEKTHPLRIIHEVQQVIEATDHVICDVGSIYMWMCRYFLSYEPRQFLTSNGQQTLGIALPWGIMTALLYPQNKVISMSGDGGFMFSGVEFETAVRLNLNIVHLVWNDRAFDMVKEQQLMKYQRSVAVEFGEIDFVKFAESFGAKGLKVNHSDELADALKQALKMEGPVLIEIPVDYADNSKLYQDIPLHIGN